MDSKDEENRIAMTLARRAYLYGAFHVVFGGGVHEASAAQLFGENTAGAVSYTHLCIQHGKQSIHGIGARWVCDDGSGQWRVRE